MSQSAATLSITAVYFFATFFRVVTVNAQRPSAPLLFRLSSEVSILVALVGVVLAAVWWRRTGRTQFLLLLVAGLCAAVGLFMVQVEPAFP